MKNPNGYGTVSKIGGKANRRKPYRVQVTIDFKPNKEKGILIPIKKTIGYARTRAEGNNMLNQYHDKPYNLDLVNITFENLFNLWKAYKKEKGVKQKTLDLYDQYYKHYSDIWNKSFENITKKDLQDIVDSLVCTKDYKGKIINVYNQMYEYADGMNIRLKNKASKLVILDKEGKTTPPSSHTPFSDEEINLLWNNRNEIIDEILVDIYTGVRPGELLVISEVHDDYFITGSKTEAGKNRVIPLNNKIKNIFHTLINNKNFSKYKKQDNLYQAWKKQLKQIGLGSHSPYDCRHTFATLMARAKADEHSVKLIMGHRIDDLTKRVYTHKLISELIEEVNKI